jgi:hypothetical protein
MLVVLSVFSLGLLGLIVYFAVSSKSSGLLKKCAIIALCLIGVSLIVCGFFIIRGPGEDPAVMPLPVLPGSPAPEKRGNLADLIILLVMLAIVGFVILLAVKRKPKKDEPVKISPASAVFQDSDDLELDLGDGSKKKNLDDSFDIEIE